MSMLENEPIIVCIGLHEDIIQSMLDYDYMIGSAAPRIKAIVASNKRVQRFFWGMNEISIPISETISSLPQDVINSTNCLITFQSGRRVLENLQQAVNVFQALRLVSIFAEQVPELHAQEIISIVKDKGIIVAGPASVGILIPGMLKLGAIGGTRPPQIAAANIMSQGHTAIISTSGGMVNELIHGVTSQGEGISFAIALGGDRFPVTSPMDAFLMAEHDQQTTQIVYFGELGGTDEYAIGAMISSGQITKKVIAYIAGRVAELFDTPPQFGHAKAMAQSDDETATAKIRMLASAGVQVIDSLDKLGEHIKGDMIHVQPVRQITTRDKRLISSRLSGDKEGDVQLLGKNLLERVNEATSAELILSILLGRPVRSDKAIMFTDHTFRMLMDHGPYVVGAVNTINAARAGKDLVSSLVSGMLTIGPRFGGAINQAASAWLEGVQSGGDAKTFVQKYTAERGVISGIGHKKYRVEHPDPRVIQLRQYSKNTNGDRYLAFADSVAKVTTSKKGNLILNVDGVIAAIMLDILESELNYSVQELSELVDIEFFNALFIASRSIGFMGHYLDQRRHDEGLLRFSEKEISYLPEIYDN